MLDRGTHVEGEITVSESRCDAAWPAEPFGYAVKHSCLVGRISVKECRWVYV